jgi:hypothetical protein
MAKNEPITITTAKSTEDILDVNFLKQSGIESIQELSGKKWTDYNIHDPGITILEILCFAFTELGFRSGYDIKDLFAESLTSKSDSDTLFNPHDILSSGAITYNDFVKIFLDVDGINNIEIVKSKRLPEFHGLFDMYVELSDINATEKFKSDLLLNLETKLATNRMLCFNIDKIIFFETDSVSLDLTIEVSKKVNQSDFIFQIVSSLERYFSPSPNYTTLDDLIKNKVPIEDVFSGPLLNNGFILNSEIGGQCVRKNIYISDMVNFLMDIDEVSHIKKIQLYDKSRNNYNWFYDVNEGCIPRLDYDKTKLTVTYKGNTSHTLLLNELFSSNVPLFSVKGKSHKKNTIEPIKGELKDLKNYNSILNDFPIIYGVGQYGLPNGGGEKEIAQVSQLRTFLFFFDQILANYFSKLDGLKDLFSLKNIEITNPVQLLDSFPGVHYCYKPFLDQYLQKHVNLNDENHLRKQWRVYLEENKASLESMVQNSIEDKASFLTRRNKILDHLLSRFGYSLAHYEFFADMSPSELITYKLNLLKELVFLGQNKFKGASDLESSIYQKSSFDHYLYLLIGVQDSGAQKLSSPISKLLDPKSNNNRITKTSLSFKQVNLSVSIERLFLLGCDKGNYLSGENDISIMDVENKAFAKLQFSASVKSEDVVQQTVSEILSLSKGSEGFYSIEHIAIRPTDSMKVFGFTVKQNKVSIFSSPSAYSRDQRDRIINSFIETSVIADSFSVVEIELNQFKILWKIKEDSILSTHFFESKAKADYAIKKYVHHFNSNEFNDKNIIRETKYNVFYNEVEDPFSNIMSFILPSWPHRFQNSGFKKYIVDLLHSETPAHVFANICWMNFKDLVELENAYERFIMIDSNEPENKELALDKLLSLLIQNE